ncbi:hypothetical protein CMI42_02910 [Candidatus Pacearchaeota archaeon]|nr:hypothetical protein [Candidatus Pacearchaeota archaeon]|tara:strand:+ start:2242 stop:2520 length:279 start_codon:yes stop_codon:yes gene_type:complete
MGERNREVNLTYSPETDRLSLSGAARLDDGDFLEVTDMLLHLAIECKHPYHLVISDRAMNSINQKERDILYKVERIYVALNPIKEAISGYSS